MTIKLGEEIELNYQDEIYTITVTNECGDCATAPFEPNDMILACKAIMAMEVQEEQG